MREKNDKVLGVVVIVMIFVVCFTFARIKNPELILKQETKKGNYEETSEIYTNDLREKKRSKEDIVDEEILMKDKGIVKYITEMYGLENAMLKNLSVEKRQTNIELKNDEIYCRLEVDDEYIGIKGVFRLLYVYYDEGGWMLESVTADDPDAIEIYPCQGVRNPQFDSDYKGDNQLWENSKVEVVSHTTELDDEIEEDYVMFKETIKGKYCDLSINHIKYYRFGKNWVDNGVINRDETADLIDLNVEGEYVFIDDSFLSGDVYITITALEDNKLAIECYQETYTEVVKTPEKFISTMTMARDHIEYEFDVHCVYENSKSEEIQQRVLAVYPDHLELAIKDKYFTTWYWRYPEK